MIEIATNVARVREVIAPYKDVTIVAVTKHQPIEKIREVVDAGLINLGVNHVQQGGELQKILTGVRLQFIGHIQSRKAKMLLDYTMIQSLERVKIAVDWQERLRVRKKPIDVLVEVNIGEEEQKSGILPQDIDSFLEKLKALSKVRVCGFMAMPPFLEPPTDRARFFKAMRALFERYRSEEFTILSMGTSTDFEVALAEGSTMVRLGTTLFGERVKG